MPEYEQVVLLVEDDPGIAELVRDRLEEAGRPIAHVTTGRAALAWLEQRRPELILLDYSLPDLSGEALVEKMAGLPGGVPPFIVITGAGDERVAVAMMKGGAKDYLVKDLHFLDTLPLVVERACREAATARQLAEAERALRERDEQLRTVTENAPDTILQVDRQGTIRYVSRLVPGLTREQVIGSSVYAWVPEEQHPVLDRTLRAVFETGQRQEYESEGPGPYGQARIYMVRVSPVIIDGQAETAIYQATDITEGKHAKDRLRESEERYRVLFDGMTDAVFVHELEAADDLPGAIIAVNQAACRKLGYTRDELLAMKVSEIDAPESKADVGEVVRRLREGESVTFEQVHVARDGTRIPVEVHVQSFILQGQRVALSVVRDITERRRAQEELRRSEAQYRDLLQIMPAGVILHQAGQVVLANRASARIFGAERPEQLVGTPLMSLVHPDFREQVRQRVSRTIQQGELAQLVDEKLLRLDGTAFDAEVTALQASFGGRPATLAVLNDITERKQAEVALRESERRMRETLENIQLLAVTLDARGCITFCNDFLLEATGWRREEVMGADWFERFVPQALPVRAIFDASLVQGAIPAHYENEILTRAGGRRLVRWNNIMLRDAQGQVIGTVSIGEDITERKQAEDQLRESEERFAVFMEHLPAMAFLKDAGSRMLYANRAYETFFGTRATGQTAPEFMAPDLAAQMIADDQAALAGALVEGRISAPDARGVRRDVRILKFPVRREGRPTLLGGIAIDETEQVKTQAALQHNQQLLRLVMDNIPQGVFWKDRSSVYLGCNQAFARDAGLPSPEAVVGRTDQELAWAELADDYRLDDRQVLAEGRARLNYEQLLVTADKRCLWVQTSKVPLRDPAGQVMGVLGAYADITERKQHERGLEAAAAINTALRRAPSRQDMAPAILEQLSQLFQASGAALFVRDPSTGHLALELQRGGPIRAADDAVQAALERALASGRPALSNHVPDSPVNLAAAPLAVQHETIGALAVARPSLISDSDLQIFAAVADIAANGLYRASLNEQTERRLRRLDALHQIDSAISASLDLRVTLDVLLDNVVNQLGVDAADVLMINNFTQRLEYAAGRGFRAPAGRRLPLRLGEELAGRAVLERRVISVPDLRQSGSQPNRSARVADEGFQAQHAAPLLIRGRISGVLEVFHRAPFHPDPEWLDFLRTLATQAAIAIDSAELFENLQRSTAELTVAYDATIEGWGRALELRDKETSGHTQRVTEWTARLARLMGFDDAALMQVRRGALLHDIGKMGVPDYILLKPGALTEEERSLMSLHPQYAYEMLLPIVYLKSALDIPYCHHEKWDGTGYPRRLRGEQIPLAARIFAVVDVWDALSSDRPYRKAWADDAVQTYIRQQAGLHFDPQVAEIFLRELRR